MVIDSSALLAVMQNEPERRQYLEAIEAADTRLMSTATFVESSIILEVRYGADGLRDLDLFLSKAEVELVPVDIEQAHVARRAYGRFGKGRHRAALNYGDCVSYALANVADEPLLCKGDDFVHTDVRAVELGAPDSSPTDDTSGVRHEASADRPQTQPVTQADIDGGESAFRAGARTVPSPYCRSDARTCRCDSVAAMSSGVDTIRTMILTASGPASSRRIGLRSLF
jgi:ribonuclease VapC